VGGRIFLTDGPRTVIRRFEDIDWLEADRKVLRVHSAGHTYTAPGPLAALEQRLDPLTFARVSRSVIVNLDRVAEIQPWFGAELVLIMADGARLTTSRGYRSRLDRVVGRVPRRDRD
jgi:two-component system LytT family response regulator